MDIRQITVVTQSGVRSYEVGYPSDARGVVIHSITLGQLTFTGDPYSHYLGFDEGGKMIFSIDPDCPHTVDYN